MNFEKIYESSNKSLKESTGSEYTKTKDFSNIENKLYDDAQSFFAEKTQEFESVYLNDAQEQAEIEDGEADPFITKIDDAINNLAQVYCDLLTYQAERDHN